MLNRLPDVELQAFTTKHLSLGRTITLDLKITSNISGWYWNTAPLKRWLRRASHPTKKGANIEFMYKASRVSNSCELPLRLSEEISGGYGKVDEETYRSELAKIDAALCKGHRKWAYDRVTNHWLMKPIR